MLKERVGTALILLVLFLAALFYLSDFQWALLMLAVTCMGAWEWAYLIRLGPLATRLFLGLTLAVGGFLLWRYVNHGAFSTDITVYPWLVVLLTVFWGILVPVWLAARHHMRNRWLMACVGMLVLIPTWLALEGLRRLNPLLLLAVMATIWIADSAAYFSGKQFGRRKLAPSISPGKTWEGVAGGLLAVALYAAALCYALDLGWWVVPSLLLLAVLSIIGDLFESLLKRQAGLKDSSNLLPGHGGVLDRIDGLTSTLPLVLFYFPLYYAGLHYA